MRTTRRYEFNAEESSDSFTLSDRAAWEANIRWARARTYTAKVQGHSVDSVVWTPNRLVRVDDDYTGTHGLMRLKAVTFNFDKDGGSTTSLGLTNKEAFTLEIEQSARNASTNEVGEGY